MPLLSLWNDDWHWCLCYWYETAGVSMTVRSHVVVIIIRLRVVFLRWLLEKMFSSLSMFVMILLDLRQLFDVMIWWRSSFNCPYAMQIRYHFVQTSITNLIAQSQSHIRSHPRWRAHYAIIFYSIFFILFYVINWTKLYKKKKRTWTAM